MPKTLKKLAPIGCNMNDAAYPFRGEHRVAAAINHGHSGSSGKLKPTTLAVRVTGTNLMIEQLDVPKGQELKCELGIDGGVPRPVTFANQQQLGLAVPGDGRDYNVTATVLGAGKHYCRMTFNGTEGSRYLRVKAPPLRAQQPAIHLTADGHRLEPSDGWYAVPIHSSECSISLSDPPTPVLGGPSVHRIGGALGQWQGSETQPLSPETTTPPQPFVVETVHDLPVDCPTPLLESLKTGTAIPLSDHSSVAVPTQEGPYRLRLPSNASSVKSPLKAPVPALVPPLPVEPAVAVAPPVPVVETAVAVPAPAPERVPELETSICMENPAVPCYVVRASGFQVHLTSETGSTASGMGVARLPLPHQRMQWISVRVLSESGKEMLRQRSQLPAVESQPVEIRVTESRDSVALTARKGSTVLLSGTPVADPESGVRLCDGSASQKVTVQQPNADGSVSSVVVNVVPRPESALPPAPTPVPSAIHGPDYAGWLRKVCDGLRDSVPTEGQRQLQTLAPPSADAAAVQQFVHDKLVAVVPEFSLVTQPTSIESVQCVGYNLTATVGHQPPYFLSTNSSIPVSPGSNVLISAVHPASGKPAGSCRVQLSPPPPNDDEGLLARILDSLQRHNLSPAAVAEDLSATNHVSLSPLGHRVLPLLVQCLRKVLDGQLREDVLFTARNGFLENIYTRDTSLLLSVSVNNGTPKNLSQHDRVPAQGTFPVNEPNFVKLTAKNVSGEVKGETILTVMGPAPELPPPLSKADLLPRTPLQPPPTPPSMVSPDPPRQTSTPLPAPAPAPPAGNQSRPKTPVVANTSVLAHHTPAYTIIPYLDVSMQQVSQDIQIRALTAPGVLIACNIDGVGGNTGKNDFITKVHAHQPHTLELSLIDSVGQVVFQQKLEVPAVSSLMWGLCLQENGMSVDPDGMATTTTISLDRSPERSLHSNFMAFDTCKPHYVCLRRYLNGLHGVCSGELAIRLPGFISPHEVRSLIHLLQLRNQNRLDDFNFERQMLSLSSQCSSPIIRDLVAVLLEVCKKTHSDENGDLSGPRVFFRLTGAE